MLCCRCGLAESPPCRCPRRAELRGAKFSGAAFRVSGPRAYYHATLLLDADLSALRHLLYIDAPADDAGVIVNGRDTASVRATYGTVNLSALPRSGSSAPLGHDEVCTAIAAEWAAGLGLPLERVTVPSAELLAEGGDKWSAAVAAERLGSRDWTYGGCPPFEASIRCADAARLVLGVRKGLIESVELTGVAALGGEQVAALEAALEGQTFSSESLLATAAALEGGEGEALVAEAAARLAEVE